MKYDEFEGSLEEFLKSYVKGDVIYYIKVSGNFYEINTHDVRLLIEDYNRGIYTEKQEVWTDHLPVLCIVRDSEYGEGAMSIVVDYEDGEYLTITGYYCPYAVPVNQKDVDKLIWKGKL